MSRLENTRAVGVPARETEWVGLLKEAFVCVSIPLAAFAFAYMTLHVIIRLFLG